MLAAQQGDHRVLAVLLAHQLALDLAERRFRDLADDDVLHRIFDGRHPGAGEFRIQSVDEVSAQRELAARLVVVAAVHRDQFIDGRAQHLGAGFADLPHQAAVDGVDRTRSAQPAGRRQRVEAIIGLDHGLDVMGRRLPRRVDVPDDRNDHGERQRQNGEPGASVSTEERTESRRCRPPHVTAVHRCGQHDFVPQGTYPSGQPAPDVAWAPRTAKATSAMTARRMTSSTCYRLDFAARVRPARQPRV